MSSKNIINELFVLLLFEVMFKKVEKIFTRMVFEL